MQMLRTVGTAPIEKHFRCDQAGTGIKIDYTYRNRASQQTADQVFFDLNLRDASDTLLSTHYQDQQTGLEFSESVTLGKPGSAAFDELEEFIISFKPYAAEPDFYRIMLVEVSISVV